MKKTKAVLIVGGSGAIGSHLALRLREGYKVFATYHRHPIRIPGVTALPMNVFDRDWAKRIIYVTQPDVVVFTAGKNDVEWAEKNAQDADRIHAGGPVGISTLAAIFQPKFIFLSNSYVFDGNRGNFRESDVVLPPTQLGKSKVAAENYIRGRSLNYVIVRSSPVFGRGTAKNPTPLDLLRYRLERGERVELFGNELHSYAPISGLVELLARVIDGNIRNKYVHYGGLTNVTQVEFAKAFAKKFGYDPEKVIARQMASQHAGSTAVNLADLFDYSLNSSFAVENLKIKPLLLEEGLDLLKKDLIPDL